MKGETVITERRALTSQGGVGALEEPGEPVDGPRLVVADDDPTTRLVLAGLLTSAGYQVAEAADGIEALARIKESRPALVILDVEMPGADGLEVCRTIRGPGRTDGPPVLILTGCEQDATVRLAFEAGATDFAAKPIAPELLLHRVRFLLRNEAATEEQRRDARALEQAQRIARLGSWEWNLPSGLMHYSSSARALLGFAPGDGLWFRDYLRRIPSDERHAVHLAIEAARRGGPAADVKHRIRRLDGSLRQAHTRAELELDGNGNPLLLHGTVQDITARVEAEERIRYLALFDQLTGLPNRTQFLEHLSLILANAGRQEKRVAVLLLDLNAFRRINETRSHECGDALLAAVGARLRGILRPTDPLARDGSGKEAMLARQDGDDFLVALGNLERGEQAAVVAHRLLESFQTPFRVGEEELTLSASVGISVYPEDGANPEELLRYAGSALEQARVSGGNAFDFFDRALGQRVAARHALEQGIRRAVAQEEFSIYYQPQVGPGGVVVGAEALLRWFLPDGTLVPAAKIMPVIEETGLIQTVVEWTLITGLKQLAAWDRAGHRLPTLSINFSARQLGLPGIVDRLSEMVRQEGITPSRITLEILEGALIELPDASARLARLRQEGFRIALDDFGTGYSALSYLPRFPIDIVKIDRSFVRELPDDAGQAAVVRAIIALATELGIEPLAEGVEQEEQREFLAAAGCPRMQGYLFGKAMPAEEFVRLLPG